MQKTQVWSLGREDPLKKEMATHSCLLAWEIPWTEEPGGLQSTGSKKSQTQLRDSTHTQGLLGQNVCGREADGDAQKIEIGFPWWLSGKESACQCRRPEFDPWVWKIPWRKKRWPTPVFLPRKSYGQSRLVSYSPRGRKRVRHDLAAKQQETGHHVAQEFGCGSAVHLWVRGFHEAALKPSV